MAGDDKPPQQWPAKVDQRIGEPANDDDPILALVPAERRSTLIARREARDEHGGAVVYRLDIVLQGRGETVFFNI